jgi:hypothetical protein
MDSWLSDGERLIEDLQEGDRVRMDVGVCVVLGPAEKTQYGMTVRVRTPGGQEFELTFPAGSPFVLEED